MRLLSLPSCGTYDFVQYKVSVKFRWNLLTSYSTLQSETGLSCETPLLIYQTTRCHIPEDSILNTHHLWDLKSVGQCFTVRVSMTSGRDVQDEWQVKWSWLILRKGLRKTIKKIHVKVDGPRGEDQN